MTSSRRPLRSLVTLVGLGVALVVLVPAPAGADPAEPGRYRSEVTSVRFVDQEGEPVGGEVEGLTVEVVGGDSFLEMTVAPGVEVEVPGYDGEPYLRVLADGTVEENERAPTTYQNLERYGAEVPADAGVDAEPQWVEVAQGGTYAWHDHRIHWMSPDAPPRLEGGAGLVQEWTVPMVVDGDPVAVLGRLDKVGGQAPWSWLAVVLVAGAGGWFLGRRNVGLAVPVLTVAGGAVATFVGWWAVDSQPASAEASPLPFVLGAVALVLALAGAGLGLRRRRVAADLCGLAAAATLGGWVLLRFGVLTNPVLPTDLPAPVDRLGTALVLGLAVASAVLVVQGGALAGGERRGGGADDGSGDDVVSAPASG